MKKLLLGLLCFLMLPALARGQLLSSYPGATILLSMTLESAAYSGLAFRVRRNSDQAQADIPFVNGIADVPTFNSFCSTAKCFMTIWYDQSGFGNNCVQATAARQWLVTVDVDGGLSASTVNWRQGCQVPDNASFKTVQPHGFAVLRGIIPIDSLGGSDVNSVIFGYVGTAKDTDEYSDATDTNSQPKSARDNASWALGWSIYCNIFTVPVRDGDGSYYTSNYWTPSRMAYSRVQTSDFTTWDYSPSDHQTKVSGFTIVPGDGTTRNITYRTGQGMVLGNSLHYDAAFQGSFRAFVLYGTVQAQRDAISSYLDSRFMDAPIPFTFQLGGFNWNAQYIPGFNDGATDSNGLAWWDEFAGYDWSFAKAATANNTELVRFEVNPNDSDIIVTGAERSERGSDIAGLGHDIVRGGNFETFAQFMIEPGPVQTGSWALTFQIHYDNSSVPDICFLMLLNEQFQVQTQTNVGANDNGPAGYNGPLIPFQRGVWYAMRVSGTWSSGGKTDSLQVWLGPNGAPLPQIVNTGGTLYATDDTGAYMKQGIYRGNPGENAGNLAIQIANHQLSLTAGAFASYVAQQPALPTPQ